MGKEYCLAGHFRPCYNKFFIENNVYPQPAIHLSSKLQDLTTAYATKRSRSILDYSEASEMDLRESNFTPSSKAPSINLQFIPQKESIQA